VTAALRDPVGRLATLWRGEVALVLAPRTGRLRLAGRIALIWAIEAAGLVVLPRYLAGVHVDNPLAALGLVIVYQVLNAALRPVVVYLLLPLLVLTFGLLAIVIAAALLWLADLLVPGVRIDGPGWALVAALGLALVNAVVLRVLDIGDEHSFYRDVAERLARRGRPPKRSDRPGFVVVQVDGLGHDILREAVRTGRMPELARWLRSGSHRVAAWECALPSQTSASQAGILLGANDGIPAFRWYERSSGRLLVSNRAADAAEIERRLSTGHGLLARNGSSIGNLVSGDARRTVLTMSTIADLHAGIGRRSRDFFLFFVNPYSTTRALAGMVGEIVRELYEARRERRRGVEPRMDRGGAFPFLRAVSCVLLRDLSVTLLVEDMVRGVAVTYADLVGYDEIAHHAGPDRSEAMAHLESVDRQLASLASAAAMASRPYRFVVLSDHGQSLGATFLQRTGRTIAEVIAELMRGRPTVTAADAPAEGSGPVRAFLGEVVTGRGPVSLVARAIATRLLRRASPPPSAPPRAGAATIASDLVVCASGNLALVYFPPSAERLTLEAIEALYPGLVRSLADERWVGFVLVRSTSDGALVVGAQGTRRLADDAVEGIDPLAPFGPLAADHLRRLDAFPEVGDLVVNSAIDSETGEVAAFEELIGSHGGLGGAQTRPFICFPADLPDPGLLVGAPAVGAALRSWVLAAEPEPTAPPAVTAQ
jgi:uncharacterized membrane protein YvlD (DUF360 family)